MYVSVTKISTELGYAVFRTEITLKQNFSANIIVIKVIVLCVIKENRR